MDKLQFFWLWYNNERKNHVQNWGGEYLNFLNLNINTPISVEALQESSIYFSDIEKLFHLDTTHVGFCSARYDEKFVQYVNDSGVINDSHELILNIIKNNAVENYRPFHTNGKNWYNNSENYHMGIAKYLDDFIKIINCKEDVKNFDLGMSNSFMIRKDLFLETCEVFKFGVLELSEKYNYKFEFSDCGFGPRAGGCLFERLAGISIFKVLNA